MKMRHATDFDFKTQATKMVSLVAETYCGSDVSNPGNIKSIAECVRLLRTKFSDLGFEEIREAFAMSSAKMLNADSTAYRDRFTVNLFGRVMATYKDYRNKILAEISKAKDIEQEENAAAIRAEMNEKIRQNVIEEFERLKINNTRFRSPEDIPTFWVGILREKITGNRVLWERARKDVSDEFCVNIQSGGNDIAINRKRCFEIVREYKEAGVYPEELYERAVNRYGRYLIFDNISPFTN